MSRNAGSYIGSDSSNEDLVLSGGCDSGAEVGVIPSIYFSKPFDDGRVGVNIRDFLGQRPVRTLKEKKDAVSLWYGYNGHSPRRCYTPESMLVVNTTGKLNILPKVACWMMFL